MPSKAADRDRLTNEPTGKRASTGPPLGASGAAPSLTPSEPTAFLRDSVFMRRVAGCAGTGRQEVCRAAGPHVRAGRDGHRQVHGRRPASANEMGACLSFRHPGTSSRPIPVPAAVEPPVISHPPDCGIVLMSREGTARRRFPQVPGSLVTARYGATSQPGRRSHPEQNQPRRQGSAGRVGQPQPGTDHPGAAGRP
jgi:hypothetical protein